MNEVLVCVGEAGIEQAGILGADGKRLIVLDGMEIDEVAQDVALDGLEERLAAAFQRLNRLVRQKPMSRLPARERSAMILAFGWRLVVRAGVP